MPCAVRISDINFGGHVSNAAVLNYFQEARIACLARLGLFTEMDIGNGCGSILHEARVLYRAEMFRGDELLLGARVEQVSRALFPMAYRVERRDAVAAEGTTTVVPFDHRARKPRRVPGPFRNAVAAIEGLAVEA